LSKKHLYDWAKALGLPRPEKALLRQLIHFADSRSGEVWATVPVLAEEIDYSERKVQYALRSLEELGAIIDTGRKHRNQTRRLVPIYRLSDTSLFRAETGEQHAPGASTGLRPYGRSFVHPHKKNSENNISKEIGGVTGNVPGWLRDAFVVDRGEAWTASYVDSCTWFDDERALRPRTGMASQRLRDAQRLLKSFGILVQVGSPA
jgi:DNA-binding transcriptional ArsR family regulator